MTPLLAAIDLVDRDRLPELVLGLAFNGIAIAILAVLTIRRARSRATNVFTMVVVNVVVFFVTYLMASASVDANVGFGLFALFGILRFRTGTMPVLDTTYLFAAIAIATFNSLALTSLTLAEAIIANVAIIGVLELLGGVWLSRQPQVHSITYERIELVHPTRMPELLADLRARTGLDVERVVVHDINFLNDTARISVHVRPGSGREDRILVHASSEQYES